LQRHCNLVFQGGGLRAIAYAGALQSMPKNLTVHVAGGASAGALIAALVAIGKTPEELGEILRQTSFEDLIDPSERELFSDIESVRSELIAIKNSGDGVPSLLRLAIIKWKYRNLIEQFPTILKRKGLYSTAKLRSWLDSIFEDRKFGDICIEDLRIVAADLNRQRYHTYSKQKNPETHLTEAIHASISIPLFFEPFLLDKTIFVDGGLLSNFPSFLFSEANYPTIGFKLREIHSPSEIRSFFEYIKGLILTMTEAHDKEREIPMHFKQYTVDIPNSISATNFSLNKNDVESLYQCGITTSNKINWETGSSTTPVISFYDPRPQDVLNRTIKEANKLYSQFTSSENWAEEVCHQVNFRVTIDSDWTVKYEREMTFQVFGERQLFFHRLKFETNRKDVLSSSLMDFTATAKELFEDNRNFDLPKIPLYNSNEKKGFILFFSPPIRAGEVRKFYDSIVIPMEFEKTLGAGQEDHVSFSVIQAAHTHRIHLRFDIYIHESLSDINIQSGFGRAFSFKGIHKKTNTKKPSSMEMYRHYLCEIPETLLSGQPRYKVSLQPGEEAGFESGYVETIRMEI